MHAALEEQKNENDARTPKPVSSCSRMEAASAKWCGESEPRTEATERMSSTWQATRLTYFQRSDAAPQVSVSVTGMMGHSMLPPINML